MTNCLSSMPTGPLLRRLRSKDRPVLRPQLFLAFKIRNHHQNLLLIMWSGNLKGESEYSKIK